MIHGVRFTNKIQETWILVARYCSVCYTGFITFLLVSAISLLIILSITSEASYASEEVRVECERRVWNVEASLSLGNINSITVNTESDRMILSVDTSSIQQDSTDARSSELSIALPRDLLDAMEEGYDVPFRASSDGASLDVEEIRTTPTHRELELLISAEMGTIQIIGTDACPPVATFIQIPTDYRIVETRPEGHFMVGTRWAPPPPIDKEQNAVLAVRFSPNKGVIDYSIEIADGSRNVFQASRSISGTSDDTIQIPRNTFQTGSSDNRENHEIMIRIERFYGVDSDERANGLSIEVIPEFPSPFIIVIIASTVMATIILSRTIYIHRGLFRGYP